MTIYISGSPRRQHATRDDAERAIEIFLLPRNPARFYEVVEIRSPVVDRVRYAVKVYVKDGRFEGFCYDSEECA